MIKVAATRPDIIPGDTGITIIVMNPADERYQQIGYGVVSVQWKGLGVLGLRSARGWTTFLKCLNT
ncbi:hypothetical protein PMIN06_011651 [Paraphaeosphaeria minitans]